MLRDFRTLLVVVALAGLAAGGLLYWAGQADWAHLAWSGAVVPVLAALLVEIVASLRSGQVGLDLVAALSMSAALTFGEALAANVVALMYAGGQLLEAYAQGRAQREMTALMGRVARTAMRHVDARLEEIPIERIVPGDRLLIRTGEVVPVDGTLAAGEAVIDASALTGESLPERRLAGEEILSGTANAGDAFDLVAVRDSADSTYAQIVKLVTEAQHSKAPAVRIADRFAVVFLVVTLVIAGAAWGVSGDRLRALAVLVVATPCPLILALPVALISGISRAARQGVLIKNGGALEALSRVRTAVFDKTGTLTLGRARIDHVRTAPAFVENELLRLAASLDQASNHVIAEALVAAARERGLRLMPPQQVSEVPGSGLSGTVEGRSVVVGGSRYVADRCTSGDPYEFRDRVREGSAIVAVAVDGVAAGIIVLVDPLREGAASMLARMRDAGITRIVVASGDRQAVVDRVVGDMPVDLAKGDLAPSDKLALVAGESRRAPTMMVGDGVNDAPALAAATIGVAMGARGSAASSQAADVVLLVDDLQRVGEALEIARRTRAIAIQSVVGGLALSLVGMVVAAFGYLPPVAGALTQEAIDVAVILNALRALASGRAAPRGERRRVSSASAAG